jgi:hypothetical protein
VLTEEEVLGRLTEEGFKIPRSRFENWRERGLLTRAESRPGRGRGLGRAANLYPEITIDQVKQIVSLRQQNFDLDEIGWRLWLVGYPVGRNCWFDVFAAAAAEFDAVASAFRNVLNSDNDDTIHELVDQAYRAETSRSLFRQVRKALGPDRLSSIVLHIMSMALGEFTAISTQTERLTRDEEEVSVTAQMQDPRIKERQADLRAMDVALGLGHARSDTVNGVGPIISGDYSLILRDTFAPLASTTLTEFLKTIDPQRLNIVTRDLSALLQSIAVASQAFDKTLGRDAFGLDRVALIAGSGRKLQAQMGLAWTLILDKSIEKFHDVSGMMNLFNAAALAVGQSAHPTADGSNGPSFLRGPTRKPIK